LVAGITDPTGRMHIHQVAKVDNFHEAAPREWK
jgi:hypothetical protein